MQKTGICAVDSVAFACVSCSVLETKREFPPDFRLWTRHLKEILTQTVPGLAGIEWGGFPRSVLHSFWMGSIVGVVISSLQEYSIPVVLLHPSEVKAHITGNGNATKTQMRLAVQKLFQFTQKNPHLVDAFSIAVTALGKYHASIHLR